MEGARVVVICILQKQTTINIIALSQRVTGVSVRVGVVPRNARVKPREQKRESVVMSYDILASDLYAHTSTTREKSTPFTVRVRK